jgi:hypothetical protein
VRRFSIGGGLAVIASLAMAGSAPAFLPPPLPTPTNTAFLSYTQAIFPSVVGVPLASDGDCTVGPVPCQLLASLYAAAGINLCRGVPAVEVPVGQARISQPGQFGAIVGVCAPGSGR